MADSPIHNLRSTFKALDPNETGLIDKHTLLQATLYTGDNYDKEIINAEI